MSRTVALVSQEPNDELARYLEDVGFEVRSYRTPLGAPRRGTLIWLASGVGDPRMVIDTIRAWLGQDRSLRAIVVTDRPTRLKDVTENTRHHVLLLPAPVFRWQLVDALRDPGLGTT